MIHKTGQKLYIYILVKKVNLGIAEAKEKPLKVINKRYFNYAHGCVDKCVKATFPIHVGSERIN